MPDQNNTPPPPERELKFQMQAIMRMMERMNFVMGNVCDRLDRVEKRGNRLVQAPKTWGRLGLNRKQTIVVGPKGQGGADYEDFEEDVDDIGDGGFEDETIGHWEGFRQPTNRRDSGIKLGANSAKGDIFIVVGDMMIKMVIWMLSNWKYLLFKVKTILKCIWSRRKRWIGFFLP